MATTTKIIQDEAERILVSARGIKRLSHRYPVNTQAMEDLHEAIQVLIQARGYREGWELIVDPK